MLGVAERAVKRITCTMCFLGMAFWFPILFYLGRVRWEPAPKKLGDEENKTVLCLQNGNSSVLCWPLPLPSPESRMAVLATLVSGLGCFPRFCVLPGFWPRWALSWPEPLIAAPATLVSGLACFPRARRARQTPPRPANTKTIKNACR